MKFLRLLVLAGSFLSTATQAGLPQDGQLDPSFGNFGKVKLAFDKGGTNADLPGKVVTTLDHTYVFGYVARTDGGSATITRFNKNGSVDTNYGTQGTVYLNLLGLDGVYDGYFLSAGVLQSDNKLVAVGQATMANKTFMLVCRLLPTGQPDASFGGQNMGCNHFDTGGLSNSNSYDVAIQPPDDKLLVVGGGIAGTTPNLISQGVVFRVDAIGSLDTSFGNAGGYSFIASYEIAKKVRILPDGRFFVATGNVLDACQTDPYGYFTVNSVNIYKYLSTGKNQDANFSNGSVGIDFTFGYDFANGQEIDCSISQDDIVDLAIAKDGSLFVGMRAETTHSTKLSAMVTKLKPDGSFDSSFGTPMGAGILSQGQTAVRVDICPSCGSSSITGFALLPDGKMVFSGTTIAPGATASDMFALRLMPDGAIDPSFGNNALGVPGRITLGLDSMPNTTAETGSSLGLSDGKPLVVGWTKPVSSTNSDYALFRLQDDRIFWDDYEK